MRGLKLYKNRDGEKLYPVCSWERNQHKLYNALDRANIRREEEGWTEKVCAEYDRIQDALEAFDSYVFGGIVYATYKDGCIIKDIIAAYDCRTDEIVYGRRKNH